MKPLRSLLFALAVCSVGCRAQTPSPADKLSPELARRVEVLIRSRATVPPNYEIQIGPRTKSEVSGFDAISVTFSADGKTSKPMTFLLSTDGKTVAQFNKYDISRDPKDLIPTTGRPLRGGPASSPVVIVVYDDLECPFCARMHAQLFPALLQRYKDQVHVLYRDFPLPKEQHPWAMRAAIDVNCVAAHSTEGYWNLVDYIHSHAAEFGGQEKSLAQANAALDMVTTDEGKKQHLDEAELKACIAKQDETTVMASVREGESLGVESTPALFVNGEKIEGAVPLEDVYRVIDGALIAAGQTPPPPPTPPAAPSASAQKAGN